MTLPGWLDDPALAPVWQSLRRPLEQGARTSRVKGLSRESRYALAGLLGRAVPGDVTVTLEELSAELEQRADVSLREVLEALGGPLRDLASERAWREAPLEVLRAVDERWAESVRTSGLLARLDDPVAAVSAAVRVRGQLPGRSRLRTELAAACAGDAHALDDGQPLAGIVLRGLVDGPFPASAVGRRAVWESVGVLADTVSSTVLTLGLRPAGAGSREDALRTAADRGDPVHLSVWDLRRTAMSSGAAGRVLVCENPSVLEAFAVHHGGRYPIVCTSGWPAAVAVDLLDALAAPLAYHGDLDWRGVEICTWLVSRCGVVPWRMSTADYLAGPAGAPLSGREAEAVWDPDLAPTMRERRVAVYEEQVVDQILADWPTRSAFPSR